MSMSNTITVIILAVVFGSGMIFADIDTFKNFKRDKDYFFLTLLIIANIAFLSVYLPAAIVAIASLL